MTGEEFWNIRRGATITVETPYSKYKKGQVLKVEYLNVNDTQQVAYIRDTSKPLGSQMDLIPFIFLLDNFVVGGELPKKDNNKVIELPFAVGDKVWFIVNNEAHEGTLTDCNISINQDGTQIYYSAIYTSNKLNYREEVHNIASSRLFSTKKKLLESL